VMALVLAQGPPRHGRRARCRRLMAFGTAFLLAPGLLAIVPGHGTAGRAEAATTSAATGAAATAEATGTTGKSATLPPAPRWQSDLPAGAATQPSAEQQKITDGLSDADRDKLNATYGPGIAAETARQTQLAAPAAQAAPSMDDIISGKARAASTE